VFCTSPRDPFCPGFGWDRVNFLPNSSCSAVFWIWNENNVDNVLMVLVCYVIKDFSACSTVLPTRRLGVHKKLEGDPAGTADPNWLKGYPIPYDVTLSI